MKTIVAWKLTRKDNQDWFDSTKEDVEMGIEVITADDQYLILTLSNRTCFQIPLQTFYAAIKEEKRINDPARARREQEHRRGVTESK